VPDEFVLGIGNANRLSRSAAERIERRGMRFLLENVGL
jgi:hypothetical protein